LQSGLPVIVNTTVSISDFLEREKCGVGVNGNDDIAKAVSDIAKHYDEYSLNACKAFDNYLNFENSFKDVILKIDSLRK
jgi:glycosyltransferase involved in cell wall biosynthesis